MPASWLFRSVQHKVIAILAGFVFVQALNIVRIISFYLGQWNYTVFEWFHLYLWPVLIMLDVLVVFAIYLQWLGKRHLRPSKLMLMRRQFVLTLILMPITFGIWYAAGAVFSPAVWLCDALLQAVYPHLIDSVWLQGMKMGALTQFGMLEGEVCGQRGGNQIELEINTRLVSYSIAFYAAS